MFGWAPCGLSEMGRLETGDWRSATGDELASPKATPLYRSFYLTRSTNNASTPP